MGPPISRTKERQLWRGKSAPRFPGNGDFPACYRDTDCEASIRPDAFRHFPQLGLAAISCFPEWSGSPETFFLVRFICECQRRQDTLSHNGTISGTWKHSGVLEEPVFELFCKMRSSQNVAGNLEDRAL